MHVDYLPKSRIEAAAMQLLGRYGQKFGEITAPPVPIDEIIECHLDLTFDFDDLVTQFGSSDVLGASWLDDKRVVIDQSLDPDTYPNKEGRYRFTVAHEIGHWILHAPKILAEKAQPSLFGDTNDDPSIVCRSSQSKEPAEWQADCFAGHLLMPTEFVTAAWKKLMGNHAPENVADEIQQLREAYSMGEDEHDPSCDAAKAMAELFNVSAQAMQIRLLDIGLLKTKHGPQGLLD
jgi:hypothetical protein